MADLKKVRKIYKVTLEEFEDETTLSNEKLVFEAESHEDIFSIVEKLQQHPDFDKNEAASLGLGLKLFSGIMLKHKENPIFKNLMPHFKDFMMGLKSSKK